MARPRRIDAGLVKRARAAAPQATIVQELRVAQAVLLPVEAGTMLTQTAALLGVGRATAARLQARFHRTAPMPRFRCIGTNAPKRSRSASATALSPACSKNGHSTSPGFAPATAWAKPSTSLPTSSFPIPVRPSRCPVPRTDAPVDSNQPAPPDRKNAVHPQKFHDHHETC
jgi:hypothetical protein